MSTGQATAQASAAAQPRIGLLRRFIQGDLAELRVILGLALIWIVFQVQEDRFLTAVNLTNLVLQITAIGLLSVGAVSGLCAAIMAVLSEKHGWSPYLAIAAGVGAGTVIGLFQGAIFTR